MLQDPEHRPTRARRSLLIAVVCVLAAVLLSSGTASAGIPFVTTTIPGGPTLSLPPSSTTTSSSSTTTTMPGPFLSAFTVTLGTGADDKRSDSSVEIELRTASSTRTFVVSPKGETLTAGSTVGRRFIPATGLRPTAITDWCVRFNRGPGDGLLLAPDSWSLQTLRVAGTLVSPAGSVTFVDTTPAVRLESSLPQCYRQPPAICGNWSGSFTGDSGTSSTITASFPSGCNPASVAGMLTFGPGVTATVCGTTGPVPTTPRDGVVFDRVSASSDGTSARYRGGFNFPTSSPVGEVQVGVTIDGTVTAATFSGTWTVSALGCSTTYGFSTRRP